MLALILFRSKVMKVMSTLVHQQFKFNNIMHSFKFGHSP